MTSAKACNFCSALAGRGIVYSTESVDFKAHDACSCSAVSVYGDVKATRPEFTPSQRRISQEQRQIRNERMREFIANNP